VKAHSCPGGPHAVACRCRRAAVRRSGRPLGRRLPSVREPAMRKQTMRAGQDDHGPERAGGDAEVSAEEHIVTMTFPLDMQANGLLRRLEDEGAVAYANRIPVGFKLTPVAVQPDWRFDLATRRPSRSTARGTFCCRPASTPTSSSRCRWGCGTSGRAGPSASSCTSACGWRGSSSRSTSSSAARRRPRRRDGAPVRHRRREDRGHVPGSGSGRDLPARARLPVAGGQAHPVGG